jgi:hypothetical protein
LLTDPTLPMGRTSWIIEIRGAARRALSAGGRGFLMTAE